MPVKGLSTRKKNFWNVWDGVREGADALADIRLAGFILQHFFTTEPVSVASIGTPSRAEFLALNALVGPTASYVVLGTDPSAEYRSRLNELNNLLAHDGYETHTQIADLALPGRWPKLLPALAIRNVGILGLDARWAVTEPSFPDTLRDFVRATEAVVYVRGALDYKHPDISVRFLRSIPAGSGMDVVAATPSSLWLAPAGAAPVLREMLNSSGLFGADDTKSALDAPIVLENDWLEGLVSQDGLLPRKLYSGSRDEASGLEFGPGWASAETDGRWTDGSEATATITLPPGAPGAKAITISGNGWVPPDDPTQLVKLGVGRNPKSWTELHFANGADIKSVHIELTPADVANNSIALHVKVKKPGRPSDYGAPDSRVLGFKFRELGLFT